MSARLGARLDGRAFAAEVIAGVSANAEQQRLTAPAPGLFRATRGLGEAIGAGDIIGELHVLGRVLAVRAPVGAGGAVVGPRRRDALTAVNFGDELLTLDPTGAARTAGATTATTGPAGASAGRVFTAPTSGRFYGKAGPGKPAFVSVGDIIEAGHTVCLLEVMKTFSRVTYGGDTLPARARVTALLVADDADVNAGDPLLALEPALA